MIEYTCLWQRLLIAFLALFSVGCLASNGAEFPAQVELKECSPIFAEFWKNFDDSSSDQKKSYGELNFDCLAFGATTPLNLAVAARDKEKLMFMLNNGASPDLLDPRNVSPLRHAIELDAIEMADLLLRNGATGKSINVPDRPNPVSNLIYESYGENPKNIDLRLSILKMSLSTGLNPDQWLARSYAPILEAFENENINFLNVLVCGGAGSFQHPDPNRRDRVDVGHEPNGRFSVTYVNPVGEKESKVVTCDSE